MKLNSRHIVLTFFFCLITFIFIGIAIQMATNFINGLFLILFALGFSIGLTMFAKEVWFD